MEKKRLVLIDAYAIIHRAFHAYPPLSTPNGQLVNAVYGFTAILLKIIAELKPTYLAVCFDLAVPTFRHEAYIAYQASRPRTHEDIKSQVQFVQEVVEAAGIPIYSSPGFEADDVIGTIARQCTGDRKQETRISEVVIVTGDRDILQLVNEKVKVFLPVKGVTEGKLYGAKEVLEYIGVAPEHIIDYKGLIGDSSDNYPGVPGIGPKTAIALLQKYGSLEGVYKTLSAPADAKALAGKQHSAHSTQDINEKVKQKLLDGYESAILSQKLARIECNVPVEFNLEKAELHDLKGNEKFISKLKEFNFKSLVARLIGSNRVKVEKKKKDEDQMDLI